MKGRSILLVAAAATAVTLIPSAAGGQAAPTLTVTPLRADPGDPVSIVIDDCTPDPPPGVPFGMAVDRQWDDTFEAIALTEESPGRWVATVSGGRDFRLATQCEGVALEAVVDIDRPEIVPMPISVPMIVTPDPPTGFFGTDCPDGTTARVLFQVEGRPAPEVRSAAIDEQGDWQVTVPDFADGTLVDVSASCGSVVYPTRTYVAGGSETLASTTTTSVVGTSTTSTGATTSAATPAAPVTGSSTYTG